jgi:hypothetical protein
MWHESVGDDKFFEQLRELDLRRAESVQAAACLHCEGGRLDRADYPRKPRGGSTAIAGESICRRISLCCAAVGCRRRSTPASLVFLGRRVYLGLAVLVESLRAVAGSLITPPPAARTVRRWLGWFQETLPATRYFRAERGRFFPPVAAEGMPTSLVERFAAPGRTLAEMAQAVLAFLAPLGASPHLVDAAISRER